MVFNTYSSTPGTRELQLSGPHTAAQVYDEDFSDDGGAVVHTVVLFGFSLTRETARQTSHTFVAIFSFAIPVSSQGAHHFSFVRLFASTRGGVPPCRAAAVADNVTKRS